MKIFNRKKQNQREEYKNYFHNEVPNTFSFKKLVKFILKMLKWMVFTFLATVTVWGFILGFTVRNSNIPGQGLEIYANKKSIVPTSYIYGGSNLCRWTTAVEQKRWEDKINQDKDVPEGQLKKNLLNTIPFLQCENQAYFRDNYLTDKDKQKTFVEDPRTMAFAFLVPNRVEQYIRLDQQTLDIFSQLRSNDTNWEKNNDEEIVKFTGSAIVNKEGKVLPLYDSEGKEIAPINSTIVNENNKLNEKVTQLTSEKHDDGKKNFVDAEYTEIVKKEKVIRSINSIFDDPPPVKHKIKKKFAGFLPTDPEYKKIKERKATPFNDFIKWMGMPVDSTKNHKIVTSWASAWRIPLGPFYGLFVYPVSMLSISLFGVLPVHGWSVIFTIFIIVLLLRSFTLLVTFRQQKDQAKMQEVQLKTARINAKYEKYDKKNKEMMQRKQMETMALYRKENIKPFAAIGSIFLTMPFFIAMWRVITSVSSFKVSGIGSVSFSITPWGGLFDTGNFIYLFIILSIIGVQMLSFKFPSWLSVKRRPTGFLDEKTKAQMKKQNRIANIMVIFFVLMSFSIPTLLGIYWIFSGLFSISIAFLQHKRLTSFSAKRLRNRL